MRSRGVERNSRSAAWAPASSRSKHGMPAAMAIGNPTEDQSEKRPPTQSWNGKMLQSGSPQSTAASAFAVAAITWRAGASGPSAAASHARTLFALAMVSSVVKVFEAITASVDAGSIPARARSSSAASMLATKRTSGPSASGAQGLDREPRPQGRAADAQGEHVGEALARGALPLPLAHGLGEDAHALALALHLRQHVRAVEDDALVSAQRRVQRGAVLARVDAGPREEPLDRRGQAALAREVREQARRSAREALLGQVHREARAREGERFAPCRVLAPHPLDALARKRIAMGEERLPGR